MRKTINAIAAIAMRDLIKLLRDRPRLFISLIFPLLFVGILGTSLNSNLSADVGYSFLIFVFTGVIGQNLFQSTAAGIISLVEDRQNDFSQAMFIAPVSRLAIILGKILGESMVAVVQLLGIGIMGIVFQIPFNAGQLLGFLPAIILVCLVGGSFGLLVMSNLSSQKQVNQIFPLLIFPQFFLAGVFSPIKNLPIFLLILSRISPMTYAVDLIRSIYYWGKPEYGKVVLHNPSINLLVLGIMFLMMFTTGTYMFVKNERNR
ncbi:MAG: ABC transporter permease [Candidatus Shapirobacteria bacterium]